ncbi:LOW QUALITY PROTEIN: hypothetical protein HID58_060575, partial [Brassica napus]
DPELIFLTDGASKSVIQILKLYYTRHGNTLFQEVLVSATILLLTLLLWLFAPPNFLIGRELLLINKSPFRQPRPFSAENIDIHRFTNHQFTISFSHNPVLSLILRTSTLRHLHSHLYYILPYMFVLNINNISSPSVIRQTTSLHNFLYKFVHFKYHVIFSILYAEEVDTTREYINMEKSRRVQVRPRSFTRKGNSSQSKSTKTMDVAHDAQLPQTSMRRQ